MADSKISNLPTATTLDGTEVLPIVQAGTTKQVSTQQLGGNVLFNGMVNDTVSSVSGSFETFTLPSTVSVPAMEIGDKIEVRMTFNATVAPASDGFGLYFFWWNEAYTPISAGSPTYGNSILQLPYDKDNCIVDIEITKLSATEVYVVFNQKINATEPTPGDYYENGMSWFYHGTLDTSAATHFLVEAYVSAGGTLNLQYLYIKHTK